MWRVLYEDGTHIDDQNTYWTDLPKDKSIVKVTFFTDNPFIGKELSGMDSYYYVKEAIAIIGSGTMKPDLVAEVIGGINLETKTVEELRFDCRTRLVTATTKPLEEYGYSKDILLPGKK